MGLESAVLTAMEKRNLVAEYLHLFMLARFLRGDDWFQQNNAAPVKGWLTRKWLKEQSAEF